MGSDPIIGLDEVSKIYPLPSGDVIALDKVNLAIDEGEFLAVMGPSGSGKSTLLNQIGSLDVPSSGNLSLGGRNIRDMSDRELTSLRLTMIGFVFQKFNLVPLLTAYENVEYPFILKNRKSDEAGGHVSRVLQMVGIDPVLATHRPPELSGGQQQRVAIARALVNDPKIILCDEPTGNLDSENGRQIMGILTRLNGEGRTIIMVTHDPVVASHARRTIVMQDGRIS
ncbi:MAG: ABC transporter ATP-binding protein [Methanoregulaceae archaeon]|jgi:putative ABC transport system ATP-binding protein|nr:ABC transporter ATP-binding protein [Methanoregulaceae archaeon]